LTRNYFIFGSQGFIGKNLIHLLIKKNISIFSLGKKKNFFKNKKVKHIKTDIYKSKKYLYLLNSNSIVVFLSASKFNNSEFKKFETLVDILKKKKIKTFLFVSSASVYGNNTNINSESILRKPINKQGNFFVKLENKIIKSFSNSDTNYVILRTFNVFGKFRNKRGMIENFIYKIINDYKTFTASGLNNLRSYITVNDLNRIIFKLSKYKKNLVINVCNPYYIFSLKYISKKITMIAKKKFDKILIKNNCNVIQDSVCSPKNLLKMNLIKFSKNFNIEIKKIIKEYKKLKELTD